MIKGSWFAVIFCIGMSFSCVESFNVESIEFDSALVVDGRFTNQKKAHHVKLSYTRPLDQKVRRPITDAQVWVEGSDGNKIIFEESEPGDYTSQANVAGLVGIDYQLFFKTTEGRYYQTGKQTLLASPPIDSVYDRYEEKINDETEELQRGIQLFIDTHDRANKAQFFKYEWEDTYEVRAEYPSFFQFFSDPDTIVRRDEEVYICYAEGKSSNINIATNATLASNRLSEVPVRYLTSETDHLKFVYSILVRQHVISAGAYSYYRDLLENNENNGSLFDKQQGVVVGNVKSVEDPDETVLGYFEVSGVSEKRTFFSFDELDDKFPWPAYQYPCASSQLVDIVEQDNYVFPDSILFYAEGKGYGVTEASYCDSTQIPLGFGQCPYYLKARLAPTYCTDCRFRGSTEKPDFWIE